MTLIEEYYSGPVTTTSRGSRWRRDVSMGVAGAVGALAAVAVWVAVDDEPDTVAPDSPSYSCAQFPLEEECTHP